MSMRPGDERTLAVTLEPQPCPDRFLTKRVVIVTDEHANQIVEVPIRLDFGRAARAAGSSATAPGLPAPANIRRSHPLAAVRPTSNGP
jgi:hypothetical protein